MIEDFILRMVNIVYLASMPGIAHPVARWVIP